MQITINGKEYGLNFGVAFIREIDKIAGVQMSLNGESQSFGLSMMKVLPGLKARDAAVLSDVIYAAAWDNRKRPSRRDVDDMIDDPKTDLSKLFADVTKTMNQANAVKVVTITKNVKA